MRTDLRIKYDSESRARAADMFAAGRGYKSVARELGVLPEAVRRWRQTYRAVGRDGLLNMGRKQAIYDWETKVAAARAVVEGGVPKPEAMRLFGIASASPLSRWCRLYREGGEEALRPRPKGRPRGSGAPAPPRTRERELEERVRKLEAQVAYLKKFRALASRGPR